MRFVSHSPAMLVGVLPKKSHFNNYGDEITDQEGYIAQFSPNDLTEVDVRFAEKAFLNEFGQIHGQTVMGDEVTPTPFIERLSVFDTEETAVREQWDARTVTDVYGKTTPFKEYVEKTLTERAVNHPDFRLVVELPAQPPWPNYMEYRGSLEQLVERLVEDGYDLLEVIRFEEQTGHRQAVIDALRETIREQQAEMADAPQVPA
jgi:hypothetical protein